MLVDATLRARRVLPVVNLGLFLSILSVFLTLSSLSVKTVQSKILVNQKYKLNSNG